MTVEAILVLLIIFDIAIIYILYAYNPSGAVNRFFCLLLIPITLTNLEMLLLYTARTRVPMDIGLNMAILGAVFFFPLLFHFTYYFPRRRTPKAGKGFLILFYVVPAVFGFGLLTTFSPGTTFVSLKDVMHPTVILTRNPPFFTFYLLTLIYMLFMLSFLFYQVKKMMRLPIFKRERKTVIRIMAGFIPLSIILLFNFLIFVPFRGGIYYYLVTSCAYTVYFVILMFQFGFIDRKAVARIFIFYPVLIGILFLFYSNLFTLFFDLSSRFFNLSEAYLQSLLVVFFLVILIPIVRFLERRIGALITPAFTNVYEILRAASVKLVHIIDLNELDESLTELFNNKLKLKNFFLYITDSSATVFRTLSQRDKPPDIPVYGELTSRLVGEKRILNMEQLALSWGTGGELEILDNLGISLVIPLLEGNKLWGMLLLSEPGFARPWHESEIEELELFASGIPVVIARCNTYKKAIELEQKQAFIEKMAVLNEIASGVAHEIRNPLSIISTSAETIAGKNLTPDGIKKLSLLIQEETERVSHLLERILSTAQHEALNHQPLEVTTILKKIFELVAAKAKQKNIQTQILTPQQSCMAIIDREAFTQVCLNIVLNAIEALEGNGTLSAKVEERGGWIDLRFSDDGEQIPAPIRKKIFNPFFTTKKRGTGLGLAVSQRLVQNAGGELNLLDSKAGNVFQILLPAVRTEEFSVASEKAVYGS